MKQPSESTTIRYEVENYVARVTIDRPNVMNAVNVEAVKELRRIWKDIETRDDIRVVILTGSGEKAFCAGADLKDPPIEGLKYWALESDGGFGGIALRETLNVPVIARVNGLALGGGFEMVLGCDLVVACEEASFGMPEALVGRMPMTGGMTLLQRQIPFRHAMGLMLTARRITAGRAYEFGLINEVVPRANLDSAVENWVEQILACAPLALRAVKEVVRRTSTMSPADAQAMRLPAVVAALHSQDAIEGVQAFQQKRKPVWTGT